MVGKGEAGLGVGKVVVEEKAVAEGEVLVEEGLADLRDLGSHLKEERVVASVGLVVEVKAEVKVAVMAEGSVAFLGLVPRQSRRTRIATRRKKRKKRRRPARVPVLGLAGGRRSHKHDRPPRAIPLSLHHPRPAYQVVTGVMARTEALPVFSAGHHSSAHYRATMATSSTSYHGTGVRPPWS